MVNFHIKSQWRWILDILLLKVLSLGVMVNGQEYRTECTFLSFYWYIFFSNFHFFCWYKLLIAKSVKNNSFLPSLNWTFSGIYGDQCCSLIEILSPLCLAHSSLWVRLTFLFWPHPNSHNIRKVSNRGFWIWSFVKQIFYRVKRTPCYALINPF